MWNRAKIRKESDKSGKRRSPPATRAPTPRTANSQLRICGKVAAAAAPGNTLMRWSYTGDWRHLSRLGPLERVFRALPEWARPCPMSTDVIRMICSLVPVLAASSLLMGSTHQANMRYSGASRGDGQ